MKEKLKFTNDQKEGIRKIINFLTNNEISSYGLYGYAGTGKTTLIVNLISFLLKKRLINSVVFTAPTNKAVNIMKSKFRNEISNLLDKEIVESFDKNITFQEQLRLLSKSGYNINFLTIHKLLSFKNEFNSSGEKIFQKGENATVNRYDLIIMDECSMLSLHVIIHLFDEIIKLKKDTTRISVPKILFVGDPAQLPPVNESNSSIFSKNNNQFSFKYFCSLLKDEKYDSNGYYNEVVDEEDLMSRFNNLKNNITNQKDHILKQIVRSNNDNILAVSMSIRDWVLKKIRIPIIKKYVGTGVEVYKKKDSTDKFINSFIKNIKSNKKTLSNNIILTWTNKACNDYNDIIRKSIFNKKKISKFEINDMLIINDFYNFNETNDNDKENRFYTSEQIKIVKIFQTEKGCSKFSPKLTKTAKKLKSNLVFKSKVKNTVDLLNINTKRVFKVWKLSINRIADIITKKEVETFDIFVIKDDDKERIEKEKEYCRTKIGELRDYFFVNFKEIKEQIDLYVIRPLWEQYSKIFNEPFANVNYGYCTTVHKSQGSTYHNVYIDINDILNNSRLDEMKRCMYTAVTRSSNKITLLI